jgi:hypothetical protein
MRLVTIWSRWQAQIRRKGHTLVTRSFMLKDDAERWSHEVELQIERGNFQDGFDKLTCQNPNELIKQKKRPLCRNFYTSSQGV